MQPSLIVLPVRFAGALAWTTGVLSRPGVFGSLIPVVTVLNAIVGMALPKLMTPYDFGTYSLAVTLFQYGLIFDIGASQLIDRLIPAHLGRGAPEMAEQAGQELLWLRLVVATATLAVLIPGLFVLSWAAMLPFRPGLGAMAGLAGIAYMVALGPACVYRAQSARRNYALSVVVLSCGLIVARPGGLALGGMNGCFVALTVWYVGFALLFHNSMPPRASTRPTTRRIGGLLTRGLPFFATSFIWAFYVTGNRWFASSVIPRASFGEFAFAANIFSLLVGAAGGFSAFYYPRLTEGIARGPAFALSARLRRDCTLLVGASAALMAIGVVLASVLVEICYPQYEQSVRTARILLVAVPPLVLASWLMPVSLSNGKRPWIDGLVVFPLATALLGISVHVLYAVDGSSGAAAASTVSAIPLVAMQLGVLCHARILKMGHAASLFGVTVAASFVLAGLVISVES
jgi:O-antigen/teichoic acid export membrane protein